MRALRIELDHLRDPERPGWASWVLLAVALAFAADVGRGYVSARSAVEAAAGSLAVSRPAAEGTGRALPLSPEEFGAAQETILRLSMPWDNVFRALEGARSDDISLLSIEPDASSGALNITGEARSYPAALTYVAWLSSEKTLRNVRLARHEFVKGDPRRPVLFSIAAEWKEGR